MSDRRVTICTVTRNAESDVEGFFDSLARVRGDGLRLVMVDCASSDETLARVGRRQLPFPITVLPLDENVGFAAGMNRAILESSGPYVLSLNADARPRPEFVETLTAVLSHADNARVAAVTGRLRYPSEGARPTLDAAGMILRPTWRHLDRGSGEEDRGQYGLPQRVFGATGAATLFRRASLEDIALGEETFLEEFHSYREDAELCLRLRERGWEIVYEPSAVCIHDRKNLPGRRRQMSTFINRHSLKNRYLLRAYHETVTTFSVTLLPSLLRELAILSYVLLAERDSLAAYGWLWRNRRKVLLRRRMIQSRRTSSRWDVAKWFLRTSRPM